VLLKVHRVVGTPGIATLPFAAEQPGEAVFQKQSFDGFQNPRRLPYLRQRGKRFSLTAGLITSTCVFRTTASAALI
jgi:nicotinamidase-related amidase